MEDIAHTELVAVRIVPVEAAGLDRAGFDIAPVDFGDIDQKLEVGHQDIAEADIGIDQPEVGPVDRYSTVVAGAGAVLERVNRQEDNTVPLAEVADILDEADRAGLEEDHQPEGIGRNIVD